AGVVEAKPEGHTLAGVELQSSKYINALPAGIPAHRFPLPFCYESTGAVTQFTSLLDPTPRSREVFTFHRPEELAGLVERERPLRAGFKAMPALDVRGMWPVQIQAVERLERSL